jgi:hypothetical protein
VTAATCHLPRTALQTITQQRSFQTYTAYHTYTIDWQPSHIRWYVDGRLLLERSAAGIYRDMPVQFQATMIAIWTKTSPKAWLTQKDNWVGATEALGLRVPPSPPSPRGPFPSPPAAPAGRLPALRLGPQLPPRARCCGPRLP